MQSTTTIKSWGALALGVFFAAVTCRTIFDDVWGGAAITTGHMQSLAAIIGAIASGHLLWPMLKQLRIAAFLGIAIIFVASTGYVVISAGARNSEVAAGKALTATSTNDERHAAIAKADAADAELAEAKRAHDGVATLAAKECRSGDGPMCKGRTKTADAAAVEVDKAKGFAILMRARADVMKPVVEAHAGYAHAARVLEALGLGKSAELQERVELILPFGVVLISEIACLVFLGMALGHRLPQPANDRAPVPAIANPERIPGKPTPPKGGRRGRKSDARVVDFAAAFQRRNGRAPSGSEIKAEFPELPTSTAYDYATRSRNAA